MSDPEEPDGDHGMSLDELRDLIARARDEYPTDSPPTQLAAAAERLLTEFQASLLLVGRLLTGAPQTAGRRQLADLAAEVARQDRFHPSGYPATRDGVFLGIQTAIYELEREALPAWHGDRCKCDVPQCGHADWQATRGEALQAAAVIMRTIRSIDNHRPKAASAAAETPQEQEN